MPNTVALLTLVLFVIVTRSMGIEEPRSLGVEVAGFAVMGLAVGLSCIPFARWVKRRRGVFQDLLRAADVLDGTITNVRVTRGRMTVTHANLAFSSGGQAFDGKLSVAGEHDTFPVDSVHPVLWSKQSDYIVVFLPDCTQPFRFAKV